VKTGPPDVLDTPPVYWTEIFSKPDGRWLPVDPIRAIVNKRKVFDPTAPSQTTSTPARPVRIDNRMQYVIAFEEDGYARDLTPRYARQYGAKVAKEQAGGRGQRQWWEAVMGLVTRPYRLVRLLSSLYCSRLTLPESR
jgi:xeroderma pigmentosum group C-complementing protein